jgi:hypothetical protein
VVLAAAQRISFEVLHMTFEYLARGNIIMNGRRGRVWYLVIQGAKKIYYQIAISFE